MFCCSSRAEPVSKTIGVFLGPAKPNPPILVLSNYSAVTVRWEPIEEGSSRKSYTVHFNNKFMPTSGECTSHGNLCRAENLVPNSAYDVTLVATNKEGSSAPSDEITLYTGKMETQK